MATIYLGKMVVPSSLRYIENLAILTHWCHHISSDGSHIANVCSFLKRQHFPPMSKASYFNQRIF